MLSQRNSRNLWLSDVDKCSAKDTPVGRVGNKKPHAWYVAITAVSACKGLLLECRAAIRGYDFGRGKKGILNQVRDDLLIVSEKMRDRVKGYGHEGHAGSEGEAGAHDMPC